MAKNFVRLLHRKRSIFFEQVKIFSINVCMFVCVATRNGAVTARSATGQFLHQIFKNMST